MQDCKDKKKCKMFIYQTSRDLNVGPNVRTVSHVHPITHKTSQHLVRQMLGGSPVKCRDRLTGAFSSGEREAKQRLCMWDALKAWLQKLARLPSLKI